jgi:hypothetical protein
LFYHFSHLEYVLELLLRTLRKGEAAAEVKKGVLQMEGGLQLVSNPNPCQLWSRNAFQRCPNSCCTTNKPWNGIEKIMDLQFIDRVKLLIARVTVF